MGKKDAKKQTTLDSFRQTGEQGAASQTPEPEKDDPSLEGKIQCMFAELQKGIGQINTKLDAQGTCLAGLQTAVDSLKAKTQQTEQKLGDTESKVDSLTRRLEEAESQITEMKNKQEDFEGRSRRNNLRLLGLDESYEARPMEPLVEEIIRELIGDDGLSPMFVVERAHRSLASKPIVGAPPRPVILRLLNYRDRDAILRIAREKGDLMYKGSKISIYPDFTLSVQNARRAFLDVKDTLRNNGVQYSMMYPARLRVLWNDKVWIFDDQTAAETFVQDNIGELQRRPPRPPRASNRRRRGGMGRRADQRSSTAEGGSSEATGSQTNLAITE